jgi:MFS family permease
MTGITQRHSRPHVVLAMLLLVYIFNFVDRQILSILAAPIQKDLSLSDGEMGALGGLAFALLYSTMAVPLAWLADRTSRSWVITVSLAVWSLFTALCGITQNFWQIFAARVGVGVGEAGGVAPSYAIISDYFPSHRRAVALSVYSLGIPLGTALGVLAGGYIAATVNWRTAFVVIGLAGLVIAPLFKCLVHDKTPSNSAEKASSALERAPPLADVIRQLARKPSFWLLSLGAASSSMLGYGIAFWLPSLLQRSFGLNLLNTSYFIAGIHLLGGTTGILLGGWLGDRLGSRDRAFYAWVPAAAYLIGVPLFAMGIFSGSAGTAFLLFLIPQAMSVIWLGPVLSAIQHLVAPSSRATAAALFLLINNLIGLGGGIYALGALSDVMSPIYGSESLRYSLLYSLGLYLVSTLLMALAGKHLRRDWHED